MMRIALVSLVFALLIGCTAITCCSAYYSVTQLDFTPEDINNNGQVAGVKGYQAAIWENGNVTYLQVPAGTRSSVAYGINKYGKAAGNIYIDTATPDRKYRAFVWDSSDMLDIYMPGVKDDIARDINDEGQVTGYVVFPDQRTTHAYLWQNGARTDCGTLGGYTSMGYAINNNGQVVGVSDTVSGVWTAFMWQNGVMTNLGTFQDAPYGSRSYAYNINDLGQVVGQAENGDRSYAALWQNDSITNLGSLGRYGSGAEAINNQGQIVGYSYIQDTLTQHAILWHDGRLMDLNNLISADSGWTLTKALGINDSGQIVGYGRYNGTPTYFLMAVPEPSGLVSMLCSLGGVSGFLYRRKTRSSR